MVKERCEIETSKDLQGCNEAIFDKSQKRIIAACDNGEIQIYEMQGNENEYKRISGLKGHKSEVNSVLLSHSDKMLVSSGNDCTFRLWQ